MGEADSGTGSPLPRPQTDPSATAGPTRRLAVTLGTVGTLVTGGCYQQVPLEGPPPVGMQVELTLSDDTREYLAGRGVTLMSFANTSTNGIGGFVLAASDDSLTIRVASTRANEFADGVLYQEVSLAFADITYIRQRKPNVAGTVAVVTAFGGLGLFVANRLGGQTAEDAGR